MFGLICPFTRFSSADEPKTIVFLTWKSGRAEVLRHLIREFQEKNRGIRVKLQVGPHSSTEYHAIVTQRLKNRDSSVDLFFMDVTWPPEFASAGWALDLTNRFTLQEQGKFLKGPISANTYKGRIYGVPCYIASGLLYYRKDLIEKYNFNPPKTWPQMLAQGEKIISGEDDPGLYTYSAQFKQYEGLVCNILEFVRSNGGAVFDQTTMSGTLKKPQAIRAIKFVRDKIIGNAAPRGVINYEEPESLDLFIQGKAIFHRNWPYAWAVANDPLKSKIAGKTGVGPLPSFKGHNAGSTLGGWQFGINRWSEHPDEAWKFIQFMTSYENQKTLALESGFAPTRLQVYKDPDVRAERPYLESFLPAFRAARPRPLSPLYPMISQELQRFFSMAVTYGDSDIPGLAKATDARIEKIFKIEASIKP